MLVAKAPRIGMCAFPVVAAAAITSGCSGPSASRPDCVTDIGPTPPPQGNTFVYALTSFAIDPTDDPESPHTGFDLDGHASRDVDPLGCGYQDYVSVLDPGENCAAVADERCTAYSVQCSCRDSIDPSSARADAAVPCWGAVDNQLPTAANSIQTIANTDLRSSFGDAFANGRTVVLVQVLDVDSFDDDPSVRVRLFRGFAAPGTACGTPAAGAAFQVDRESLRPGGLTIEDPAVELTGSIHDGRLRATNTETSTFTMILPTSLGSLAVPLHRSTLAMDITPSEGRLGNFGAWVLASDLISAFAATGFNAGDIRFGRDLIDSLADIQVNGSCGTAGSPSTAGGMSIGFGFTSVAVRFDDTRPVVSSPESGTCAAHD